MHLDEAMVSAALLGTALAVGWQLKGLWLRFGLVERFKPKCTMCGSKVAKGERVCGFCSHDAAEMREWMQGKQSHADDQWGSFS